MWYSQDKCQAGQQSWQLLPGAAIAATTDITYGHLLLEVLSQKRSGLAVDLSWAMSFSYLQTYQSSSNETGHDFEHPRGFVWRRKPFRSAVLN